MPENVMIVRPELTMPEAESAFLRAAYSQAKVILEYGCGGSTVMASERPGITVQSVESDRVFMANLKDWFDANPPQADVRLFHADIGPTVKWGAPENAKHWQKFHKYPLSIWDRPWFQQPDVVLIDGRFRTGCFMATALRTIKPVQVYFDDYTDRPVYHDIEKLGPPAEIVGRMARFEVQPLTPSGADMTWIMTQFARIK